MHDGMRGLVSLVALCAAMLFHSSVGAADPAQGRRIFETHCVACHGPAGHPDPDSALVQALGVTPANFSDALFNSREPADDWRIVIAHGGPALGFSDKMPAFGETLDQQQIEDVLAYVKTLGGAHDYPDGALNLFLPLRTRKAFPEDEWVWKVRHTDSDGPDQWRHVLEYEWRIGQRWQGVLEASYLSQGDRDRWDVLEPGFKYVLRHDAKRGVITTLGANVVVPLRSDRDWEVLPYIAMGRLLGEDWTLQSSARLRLPVEDPGDGSAELAGVVHWAHSPWPRNVFPGLELVAEVPFDRAPGNDRVQLSVLPQVRIGLSKRGHVAVNLGLEEPLNDRDRYDRRAYMYLIWDFADGGFFDGW